MTHKLRIRIRLLVNCVALLMYAATQFPGSVSHLPISPYLGTRAEHGVVSPGCIRRVDLHIVVPGEHAESL
ncbi:hypothetical protein F4775DRAFT_537697 [Biscogniauxia sp. FL1348]|nr:hypothetical protein F4775DRAFT_537697 [Biscogniauxia sp. FL1348]